MKVFVILIEVEYLEIVSLRFIASLRMTVLSNVSNSLLYSVCIRYQKILNCQSSIVSEILYSTAYLISPDKSLRFNLNIILDL